MNTTDYRATALLTEHLGYPPLTFIDNVINAVNTISYKCMNSLETYLKTRQTERDHQLAQLRRSDHDVLINDQKDPLSGDEAPYESYLDEAETGTGKLESLLMSQIDKNFDKFELYAFRNIFTIPKDLIEEGWIRLKHHENVKFDQLSIDDIEHLDNQIAKLIKQINLELKLRKILKLQLMKADKIIQTLKDYKHLLHAALLLDDSGSSDPQQITPDLKTALTSLQPISDNLHFILIQVDELIAQVLALNRKFLHNESLSDLTKLKFAPSFHDKYVQCKTFKLLEKVGVLNNENIQSVLDPVKVASSLNVPQPSESDVESLKNFNQSLSQLFASSPPATSATPPISTHESA